MSTTKYIISALFAICGIAAAGAENANAAPIAACSNPGVFSPDSVFDFTTDGSTTDCSSPRPVVETVSFTSDIPGVRAAYSPAVRLNNLPNRSLGEILVAVVNRSGGPVTYSPNSPLILFPKDARFPLLTLSALQMEVVIADEMQDILIFDIPTEMFDEAAFLTETGSGSGQVGYAYNSMPRGPLTEADCPAGVNDAGTDCIPLTEAFCAELEPTQRFNAETGECEEIPPPPPDTGMTATVTPPGNGGGGDTGGETVVRNNDKRDFPVVGAIVMGVLMFGLSQGGEEGEFSYSPAFGYSVNESGYSANVGGRMNFRKDEWTLFYTAGQANANGEFGEFRYASGGEYKTDFWKAAFSESVQGKTADYDLALSADLSGGIWSLSPVYRFHSRLEEGESATRNSFNLEGVLQWNRWTIRPSAGFGWRRMENFGDSAKFRLEAVREF